MHLGTMDIWVCGDLFFGEGPFIAQIIVFESFWRLEKLMQFWSVTPKLHKNMGYINREMEKTLLEEEGESVVYSGEFENTAGDIEVVNYRHLNL